MVTVDGNWVVLGMTRTNTVETETLSSVDDPAIKFEENGVIEFGDDKVATVSYTLDLSSLSDDGYTAWSLNYGNTAGEWKADTCLFIQKRVAHEYTVAIGYDEVAHTIINSIKNEDDMHTENLRLISELKIRQLPCLPSTLSRQLLQTLLESEYFGMSLATLMK